MDCVADRKLEWNLRKLEHDLADMDPSKVTLKGETALLAKIELLKDHARRNNMPMSPTLEQIIRNTRYSLNSSRGKRCIAEGERVAKKTKLARARPKITATRHIIH